MYGGAARPTSPLDTIVRSTSMGLTEEEEKKLT
jgi:hypothetical protein